MAKNHGYLTYMSGVCIIGVKLKALKNCLFFPCLFTYSIADLPGWTSSREIDIRALQTPQNNNNNTNTCCKWIHLPKNAKDRYIYAFVFEFLRLIFLSHLVMLNTFKNFTLFPFLVMPKSCFRGVFVKMFSSLRILPNMFYFSIVQYLRF